MKTGFLQPSAPGHDAAGTPADPQAAAIVEWADLAPTPGAGNTLDGEQLLVRARAFAEPLLSHQRFDTGEHALRHADGVSAILKGIGAPPALQAVAYLVYAGEYLTPAEEVIGRAFGQDVADLVGATRKLVQVQRSARDALGDQADGPLPAEQVERIRKMLLAFSRDLRVVLLRLASRLQTLRHYAESKLPCPRALARESMQVFAPLANRLGIWQIKWELEDLSFRFLQPDTYKSIARMLDETRVARERSVEAARVRLQDTLRAAGIDAQVQGRPKHLYSIWKKMQGKDLPIERVFDVQALRVIVPDVHACYEALSRVHELWRPLPDEFSDYIARPKANGYQSLHTVVLDDAGRPIEIQLRTQAMHEHAESGVAAHWAYKEAGAKGYAGVHAAGEFESRVAEARKTVLRQLLAWERDLAQADATGQQGGAGLFDDRIYVFTPEGTIIDLPLGATPVDFAYTVHTNLGHRCRGARVDGAMVPLNTPLSSGQTVEVIAAKEGGPSMDWLNPELGYVRSPRARAKVRAWFNALAQQATIAKGRDAVEKLLQRAGKTALKLDDLAAQLGFRAADALFEVVGKDEYSLRNIEAVLKPAEPAPDADQLIAQRLSRGDTAAAPAAGKGVLVVGMDSLLTQLARCCKPAPGDNIGGYVTRGKGVAVHRADCSNLRQMAGRHPERVIPVAWGAQPTDKSGLYSVDVQVEAHDRPGLLRDVCDAFAQGKAHVSAMQSQSHRDHVTITLTVQTTDTARLAPVLSKVGQVGGVIRARRK
ncbi:bifunctional (p)ppGpp synthetase/guanosine-3',5'-bis(diphosphate) 3'-pyrophosphohydrolase [Aquabacterium soli]|uniref:GTP pyrophosphokinase n=1 Tax=Aquabacterium soli TaxID=2493092 RepID=A0A3R8SB04_9BURK|nr:bifunctional (p)ppGpp synthetase/guanosine-3',5'-bis(diphosphate) 3'-pyrophosphohydrolase [Aquabacterium soli]RRS05479.1 bifunctional (p)ppGpp synthetase/guanosine-3',5'-bis(diphosphate) 3'-pyrophosphohydrolase [Aquabacterium soli]